MDHAKGKVDGLLIEWGRSFQPDYDTEMVQVIDEVSAALVRACLLVDEIPKLQVTPGVVAFNKVRVGTSKARAVQVSNVGTAGASIVSTAVEAGTDARPCEVAGWSPDGHYVLASLPASSFDDDLVEVRVAYGTARLLTVHAAQARFEGPVYDRSGEAIFLLTNRDSDAMALELRTIVDVGWDIEDLALSPDGERLAYAANVDGYSEIHVLELASGTTRQIDLPVCRTRGTGSCA